MTAAVAPVPALAELETEEARDTAAILADLARLLLAVDPQGLGGALVCAAGSVEAERWLAPYRALVEPFGAWRRLPVSITDDRLVGGLDVAETLARGTRVLARGLLAEADGGTLLVARAADLPGRVVSHLAGALDTGAIAVERDGMSAVAPARVSVVAVVQGDDERAELPAALAERLALHVTLPARYAPLVGGSASDPAFAGASAAVRIAADATDPDDGDAPDDDADAGAPAETPAALVAAARARLASVTLPREAARALCEAADALGVASPRVTWLAVRCALASAALEDRPAPNADDLQRAVQLVLAPRATRMPVLEEERPQEPEPTPPQAQQPEPPTPPEPPPPPQDRPERDADEPPPDDDQALDPQALGELLLEAAQATLPKDLLTAQGAPPARSAPKESSGRKGEERRDDARGRRVGTRQGKPRGSARLDVVESLRAAAPWQGLRAAARRRDAGPDAPAPTAADPPAPGDAVVDALAAALTASGRAPARRRGATGAAAGAEPRTRDPIEIRPEDLRVQRRRRKMGTTTLFVVDASGSAALGRLAEAKGAVELLLAESYVRRDRVGLIAFKGQKADLLLPPTRALTRARRAIGALPGGGGTPLAAAIVQAAGVVDGVVREGARAAVVFLTDGRANVALDGTPGRPKALEDARVAAQALRARRALVVVVDTSPRGDPNARTLAEACAARYVSLPVVTARALHAKVRDAVAEDAPVGARR